MYHVLLNKGTRMRVKPGIVNAILGELLSDLRRYSNGVSLSDDVILSTIRGPETSTSLSTTVENLFESLRQLLAPSTQVDVL